MRKIFPVSITVAAAAFAGPAQACGGTFAECVWLCFPSKEGRTTSQCKPTLRKLEKHLASGGSFPAFPAGAGGDVRIIRDPYDPCPAGTAAQNGLVALASARARYAESAGTASADGENFRPRPRACVGHQVGSYRLNTSDGVPGPVVRLYDSIEWQQPQHPAVYIISLPGEDGQARVFSRVRPFGAN